MKRRITHLSLFTGIGGLDLSAEIAGIETVGQCEWADYPSKVLEKHWPDVPRWKDIRTLTGESFYERTGLRTVDVISGGFPCQPFSIAGKQRGKEDDRFLWPEMVRVIEELRPTWIVGENVAGIIKLALSDILSELEACGGGGMTQGHFLYQLALSEPDTEDTELRLWATPNTMDYLPQRSKEALERQATGSRKGRKRPANLREQVCPETVKAWEEPKLWKTPVAADAANRQMFVNSRGEPNLSGQVKLWPTPKASDYKGSGPAGSKSAQHDLEHGNLKGVVMYAATQTQDYRTEEHQSEDTECQSPKMNEQAGAQLNPYWVEWLVGFPVGWTEIWISL